ncbi:MAG: class I SAM-dependent methyltransferase [Dehalococcoidia bacterium]|nr:class I SAM-dependent methyltransferase [Dehalococcoidia bacterium]
MIRQNLKSLWDNYARTGYANIYLVPVQRHHRDKLGELFLCSSDGTYLDAGCGTGNMFELAVRKIQPEELHGVDWSEEMLEKAQLEARRLEGLSETRFRLYFTDLTKPWPWPDNSFHGAIANLLICYLTCGWKHPLEELSRVIRPGGYLHLGTLLKEWGFTSVLWKHAPQEFVRDPVSNFRGLKYRRIVSRISREAKTCGAEFPSRQELMDFMAHLGFDEIEIIPTYWGGGVALRARVG